jgi:hypothetical protein
MRIDGSCAYVMAFKLFRQVVTDDHVFLLRHLQGHPSLGQDTSEGQFSNFNICRNALKNQRPKEYTKPLRPYAGHYCAVGVKFPDSASSPALFNFAQRQVPALQTEPEPSHRPTHLYTSGPVHSNTLDQTPGPSQQLGSGNGCLLHVLQLCQSSLDF